MLVIIKLKKKADSFSLIKKHLQFTGNAETSNTPYSLTEQKRHLPFWFTIIIFSSICSLISESYCLLQNGTVMFYYLLMVC